MSLTIRMRVTSVTSSEPDPEAPPLDLVSEGLRRRRSGTAAAVTTVQLRAGDPDLEAWNAPAVLWLTLEGSADGPAVGTEHDVTIAPAPVSGTAE
jgi:hypothetical protein